MASDYDSGGVGWLGVMVAGFPSSCLDQNPSKRRRLSTLGANLSDPVNLRFAPCTQ